MTTQMDPPDWLDLDIDDDERPNCDGGGWVESCHVDCCDCTNPPCAWSRCDYCNHDWVNIPESGWHTARLAVIESGPVIDGILVADANERAEIWAIPGQPFGTTDIAGWEIGPRIPTPAERDGRVSKVRPPLHSGVER